MESGHLRIDQFEKYHAARTRTRPGRPTARELGYTILMAFVITPFLFITFFVLPLMGQITVAFAAVVTVAYLFARRSLLVTAAVVCGAGAFSMATFLTIQAIKYRLDIPLFIFLVLGVPVTLAYCVFLGSRIWVLKGGAQ